MIVRIRGRAAVPGVEVASGSSRGALTWAPRRQGAAVTGLGSTRAVKEPSGTPCGGVREPSGPLLTPPDEPSVAARSRTTTGRPPERGGCARVADVVLTLVVFGLLALESRPPTSADSSRRRRSGATSVRRPPVVNVLEVNLAL